MSQKFYECACDSDSGFLRRAAYGFQQLAFPVPIFAGNLACLLDSAPPVAQFGAAPVQPRLLRMG